jgi:hypothetical protein
VPVSLESLDFLESRIDRCLSTVYSGNEPWV